MWVRLLKTCGWSLLTNCEKKGVLIVQQNKSNKYENAIKKSMKQYEYLEHTAEAKFAAYGKTMEEAFCNAALAMENIMVETEKVKPKVKKKIVIETKHTKALLYDFLQELLVLFDSERFALHTVEELNIQQRGSDYHLYAIVSGDDAQHYEMHSGVKSVTYNEMEIVQEKEGWKVVVVLDV